jgi:hypothetical protein
MSDSNAMSASPRLLTLLDFPSFQQAASVGADLLQDLDPALASDLNPTLLAVGADLGADGVPAVAPSVAADLAEPILPGVSVAADLVQGVSVAADLVDSSLTAGVPVAADLEPIVPNISVAADLVEPPSA